MINLSFNYNVTHDTLICHYKLKYNDQKAYNTFVARTYRIVFCNLIALSIKTVECGMSRHRITWLTYLLIIMLCRLKTTVPKTVHPQDKNIRKPKITSYLYVLTLILITSIITYFGRRAIPDIKAAQLSMTLTNLLKRLKLHISVIF